MKTTLILYAVYFFACLGFGTKPTAEGLFLPFIVACVLANFMAIKDDNEVNIYFTKKQVDRLNEAVEEIEK
jgi:hypothetical protein